MKAFWLIPLALGVAGGTALAIGAEATAGAGSGAAAMMVRGPAPLSDATTAESLHALLPSLVSAAADQREDEGVLPRIQAALDRAATPALTEAWRERPGTVFTSDHGLTAVGKAAMTWLAEGRHHGLDAATAAHEKLAAIDLGDPDAATERERLTVDDRNLVAAWRASGGATEERLRAAARWLDARDAVMHEAATRHARRVAQGTARRAELEVGIARALLQMAVELPQRPRQIPILADEEGNYLSPDVLWKQAAPITPTTRDARAMLVAARTGAGALGTFMREREPRMPQYRRLIEAIRRYEAICARGEWPKVLVPRRSVGKGWNAPDHVRTLQRRLAAEGFYDGEISGKFDDATDDAMEAFQRTRDLKPNGRLNKPTARQLNIPCRTRLDVLGLNVRRWRFSARTDEQTYVFVNLPSFRMQYVRHGELRADFKAIVGRGNSYWDRRRERRMYKNASPILDDVIESIILNPSWKIPPRAVLTEIKPAVARDPDYLDKHGIEIETTPTGGKRYVQHPGPDNALGDVKFNFPNGELIYMHDTNKRGLFWQRKRDFSHGCVRVDKAVELATMVYEDDLAEQGRRYTGGFITITNGDKTVRYALDVPVPVFLEYYTASVLDDGTVKFHHDIYHYDYQELVGPIGREEPAW